MQINNFKYVLDMETGSLYIIFNENKIAKTNYYNNETVCIGTDKNDNIVEIVIKGFGKYFFNKILNSLYKKLI